MHDTLKVVSWNIAGGRKVKSGVHFDYEPEDLDYFVTNIQVFKPDIICLQESLINKERSIALELSKLLSYSFIFDSSAHHIANHIDPQYELSMSIISKIPLRNTGIHFYPDPSFELLWKDGSKALPHHHKFLQIAIIDDITIANTQMLPLRLWGHQYDRGAGVVLAQGIEEVLLKLRRPIIFCGDFNFDQPPTIYPRLFKKLDLNDALPSSPTRPGNGHNKPDHIYFSPEFSILQSKIRNTQTDHYLCFAEFNRKV